MIIEPMRVEDLDAVDEIERHSFRTPWPASVFAEELTRTWARLDVARDGARLVGFADYWLVTDELQLLAIATHPDWRRRGVGRALLEHVLAVGRQGACATVTLEVRASNLPALTMYERAGFARVGVRPRYYAEDDEDAVMMTLALR